MMMLIYTKGEELCQYKVWGLTVYNRNGEKIYYIGNARWKSDKLDLDKYSKNSRILYDNDENIKYIIDGEYVYEYGSTDWKYKVENKCIYEKGSEECIAQIGYSTEKAVRKIEKMYTFSEWNEFYKQHRFSELCSEKNEIVFEYEASDPYPEVSETEEILYKSNCVVIARGKGEFRGFIDEFEPELFEKHCGTGYDFVGELGDFDLYIEEGITKIADEAFGHGVFDSLSIQHVVLPSTIEEIGTYAFKDCDILESIVIPEGLKYIRKGAFVGCAELRSIELPSTIEVIEEDAFYGCGDIEIKINKPEGSVAGAPWRADDANVIWSKQIWSK